MDNKKAYAGRLKGGTSLTDDSNGYDLLGHVRDAGLFFATGQVPTSANAKAMDPLDRELKMQRLQTGNPDFIREQNALKLKTEFDNKIAQEKAMIEEKRQRQLAMGGQPSSASGASFGIPQQGQSTPAFVNGQSPLGQIGNKSPKLMYSVPKVDPDTGVAIPDYQLGDNPDYISVTKQMELDEAEKQKLEAAEAAKVNAQNTLNTIGQIEKGKQYFGFGGKLPSEVAPSSYNPIKNPLMPLGFDKQSYEDRSNWQSELNRLTSQLTFDQIQKMQAASATGATGLGPVSEPEFKALQSAATALNAGLGEKDAMRILQEIRIPLLKLLGKDSQGTVQQPASSSGLPDDQAYQEYLKMVGGR